MWLSLWKSTQTDLGTGLPGKLSLNRFSEAVVLSVRIQGLLAACGEATLAFEREWDALSRFS